MAEVGEGDESKGDAIKPRNSSPWPGHASAHPLENHAALELGKHAHHLEHGATIAAPGF
jgi:hypothetical protein